MMTQPNVKKGIDMAGSANLRRQIRTEANARFLRNLPNMKTDRSLPEEIEHLLARLEQAEGQRRLS
ncbi:MAG TPA: hypothetical protein VGN98_12970 [Tianweitania sediminis]|jgi:hypothetical protein|nr:hypothetical protein [Tianweitania sediminis]